MIVVKKKIFRGSGKDIPGSEMAGMRHTLGGAKRS
jgi:hypothetical protein